MWCIRGYKGEGEGEGECVVHKRVQGGGGVYGAEEGTMGQGQVCDASEGEGEKYEECHRA